MRNLIISILVLGFLFPLMPTSAVAVEPEMPAEISRIETSTQILNELMATREAIPEDLIRSAHGIAIFPNVLKAAFLVGARFGEGVFVARQANGAWSEPSFLSLYGASFGFQAGAESTDLVLVFRTRESVEALGKGDITLGGTVSVAAGPVGRSAQASTDIQLRAEIYSYSKTRGLFAGVALDGAGIQVDTGANQAIYGTPDPLRQAAVRVPDVAKRFSCVVAKFTGDPGRVCV
ncbi:MAG: lipid-binding SYLF domain-containing protein [Syntrophobacteraceae bacterium]